MLYSHPAPLLPPLCPQVGCTALLLLLFRLMGHASDAYLSSILSQICQEMGLPPRLGGVTLLALGNGAPDLSSCIAAVKSGEGWGSSVGPRVFSMAGAAGPAKPSALAPHTFRSSPSLPPRYRHAPACCLPAAAAGNYRLAMGALTGAGMFVGCVVAGNIVVRSGGVTARGAQVRDIATQFVTVLVLMAIGELSSCRGWWLGGKAGAGSGCTDCVESWSSAA